ncbi:MAG: hypothetical protein JXR86_00005 [Spirochaetales bacterium]|nr:hypothetical protein [Spirochaetales bacterium]
MEDYIKIVTESSGKDISFNTYVYLSESRQWVMYGAGTLPDSGDIEIRDRIMRDDIAAVEEPQVTIESIGVSDNSG